VTEIGRRLFAAVESVFPQAAANIDDAPVMRHHGEVISLPRRRASYQEYLEAKERLHQLGSGHAEDEAFRHFCQEVERNEKIPGLHGPYDSKTAPFVLIQNNKAVVQRYHDQNTRPTWRWNSTPFGLVTSYSSLILLNFSWILGTKSRPERGGTDVHVELCGGMVGYLPSARAERLGGYGGLIIKRPCRF